jgi:Icc-related predicted phosphoesterase
MERDYYTIEAYEKILNYFEDLGEDVELDVIAICCDFTESTMDEIIEENNIKIKDEENKMEEVLEYLEQKTWVTRTTEDKILYLVY